MNSNINNFHVIWLTGMSGSGKSTLAEPTKIYFEKKGLKVSIVDGDCIRDQDVKKLGFGRKDVLKNNLRIVDICMDLKNKGFNLIIVPVISPYKEVRSEVRSILGNFLCLVYIKSSIETLRKRDTKGLYAASDSGKINDLIGYSDINPYDVPINPEYTIDVDNSTLEASKSELIFKIENFISVKK